MYRYRCRLILHTLPTPFESGININGMLSDLCARASVCVYVRVQACVCACACVRADKRR